MYERDDRRREAVARAALGLLDASSTPAAVALLARELHVLLANPVADLIAGRSATALPSGIAISPADALTCTLDPIRTATFLRAVAATLRQFEGRRSSRIEIVYAGTGPIAPLVLPLLAIGSAPVNATLLDVHESSTDAVRRLLGILGIDANVVTCDATTYRHPVAIDLAIIETMQRALTREPQFAITRNLAAQLDADGVLVPRCIRVGLAAADPSDPDGFAPFATVFELDAASARADLSADGSVTAASIRIEQDFGARKVACLTTEIEAAAGHELRANDSGLTAPHFLWDVSLARGTMLEFRYATGDEPGFRCIATAPGAPSADDAASSAEFR